MWLRKEREAAEATQSSLAPQEAKPGRAVHPNTSCSPVGVVRGSAVPGPPAGTARVSPTHTHADARAAR